MELDKYKKLVSYILESTKKDDIDIPNDIILEYYNFRENLFKYLGVSIYSNLSDYEQQAIEYLNETFPYSFTKVENLSVDAALKKYIVSIGGKSENLPEIIQELKNTKMYNFDNKEKNRLLENEEMIVEDQEINLNNVCGTSVSKYQYSNLYDILIAINDKNINSFIHYLVVNNIFNDEEHFNKVFKGTSVTIDNQGKTYISEGNHRTFVYLSLLKIREYLNIKSNSKEFNTISTAYKSIELDLENTSKRGK